MASRGLLTSPLRPEDSQHRRWNKQGVPSQDGAVSNLGTSQPFSIDPQGLQNERKEWPNATRPGNPITVQLTRSADNDVGWNVLVDGLLATSSLSVEGEKAPDPFRLPPPFAKAPITTETVARPLLVGVHLEEGAMAPQDVEVILEQVIVSKDRVQEENEDAELTTAEEEVQTLERIHLKPSRETNLSANAVLFPYLYHAPATPTLGLLSNQAKARWNRNKTAADLYNTYIDAKNAARQAYWFLPIETDAERQVRRDGDLRGGLLNSFNQATASGDIDTQLFKSIKTFSSSLYEYVTFDLGGKYWLPKQDRRVDAGAEPSATNSTTVFGSGSTSSALELANHFEILTRVSREEMFQTVMNTQSEEEELQDAAKDKVKVRQPSLRQHLANIRARLVAMGEQKTVVLLEALLGARPHHLIDYFFGKKETYEQWGYRQTLLIDQVNDTLDDEGLDPAPDNTFSGFGNVAERGTGPSLASAIPTDKLEEMETKATSYVETLGQGAYTFFYTNVGIGSRARNICKLRLRIRVREHYDDKWRTAVFEAHSQDGIAAHAVLSEYPKHMQNLTRHSRNFISTLKEAKEVQSLANRLLSSANPFFAAWRRAELGPSKSQVDDSWIVSPEHMEQMCMELVVRHHEIVPDWPPLGNDVQLSELVGVASRATRFNEFKKAATTVFDNFKEQVKKLPETLGPALADVDSTRKPPDPFLTGKPIVDELLIEVVGHDDVRAAPTGLSHARLLQLKPMDSSPAEEADDAKPYVVESKTNTTLVTVTLPLLIVPQWKVPPILNPVRFRFSAVQAPGKGFVYWSEAKALFSMLAIAGAFYLGYGVPFVAGSSVFESVLDFARSVSGLVKDVTVARSLVGAVYGAVQGSVPSVEKVNKLVTDTILAITRINGESIGATTSAALGDEEPRREEAESRFTLNDNSQLAFTGWAAIRGVSAVNSLMNGAEEAYERTDAATRDASIQNVIRGNPIQSCVAGARTVMKLIKNRSDWDLKRPSLSVDNRRVCFFELRSFEANPPKEIALAPTNHDWARIPDTSLLKFTPPLEVTRSLYESQQLRGLPFQETIRIATGTQPKTTASSSPQLSALFAYNEILRAVQDDRRQLRGEHIGQSAAQFAQFTCVKVADLLRLTLGPKSPTLFVHGDDVLWSCLRGGHAARLVLRNLEVYKTATKDIATLRQSLQIELRAKRDVLQLFQTAADLRKDVMFDKTVSFFQAKLDRLKKLVEANVEAGADPDSSDGKALAQRVKDTEGKLNKAKEKLQDAANKAKLAEYEKAQADADKFDVSTVLREYKTLKKKKMADIYRLVWATPQRQVVEDFCVALLAYAQEGLLKEPAPLTLQRRILDAKSSLGRVQQLLQGLQTPALLGSLVVLFSHSQLFEFQDGTDEVSRAVQKRVQDMVQDARDTIIQSSQPRLAQRTHSWTRHELRIAWGSRRLNLQSVRRERLTLETRPVEAADTVDKESALVKRMAGLDLETEPTEPLLYFVPVGLRLVATGSSIEFGLGSMDQRLVQPNHLSWALAKARDTTLARNGRVVEISPRLVEYGDSSGIDTWLERHPLTLWQQPDDVLVPLKVWVVRGTRLQVNSSGGGSWNLDVGRAWTEILFQGGLDTSLPARVSSRMRELMFNAERLFQSLCLALSLEEVAKIKVNIPKDMASPGASLAIGLALLRAEMGVDLPRVEVVLQEGDLDTLLKPMEEMLARASASGVYQPLRAVMLSEVCLALVAVEAQ